MTYLPDSFQKFMFVSQDVKGILVHLDNSFQETTSLRPYPDIVQKFLGELLVAIVCMMSSIKFDGELDMQFQGDERLSLLLAQCTPDFTFRSLAEFTSDLSEKDYLDAFLKGQLVINMRRSGQLYQSVVPLLYDTMQENLMHYFAQSEQLSTRFWFATNKTQAAGMMLQLMPSADSDEQREFFWEHAQILGETITDEELLSLDNVTLLKRLYHEEDIQLFDEESVRYQCRCSTEKTQKAIKLLGREDADQAIKETGKITVTCEFCLTSYHYDSIDVAMIFAALP